MGALLGVTISMNCLNKRRLSCMVDAIRVSEYAHLIVTIMSLLWGEGGGGGLVGAPVYVENTRQHT